MTEYIIAGQKIQIPTEVENERYLNSSTRKSLQQIGPIFDQWYSKQKDINSIAQTWHIVLRDAVDPIMDAGIEMFNAKGLYTINRDLFWDEISDEIEDLFLGALGNIADQIDQINAEELSRKYQRQLSKASRGRVIGGGFGLEGAIKGMVSAGAINAATGMAYSIRNAVGNMGTSMAASNSRDAVIRNAQEPLKEALIVCGCCVVAEIRNILCDELHIYCDVPDIKQAQAILSNYTQDKIPKSQKTKQIINALLLNPYSADIYDTIWNDYGDKNGDLMKMSESFGDALKERIGEQAEKFGEEIYLKYFSDIENEFNKALAGVRHEQQIKQALDVLNNYCSTHNISTDMIPLIERIQQLLEYIDLRRRTVHGTVYDTRKLAEDVKKDYALFYELLSEQDINDEQICQKIRAGNYLTNEFKNKIELLLKEEQSLRNPNKIFENITMFVRKGLDDDVVDAGWIDVPDHLGAFSQKKSTVYSLTGMPHEEIPLILFDGSSNGRSGVLLTNLSIRVYAKGSKSNVSTVYPIETVENVECYENNKYIISLKGKENVRFMFSQNLSVEDQIALGEVMTKLVRLIKNLPSKVKKQLYRMTYGTITCICGTRLLPDEKICPVCHSLVRENGEIVESQCCPECGNFIPIKKKFCSVCGLQLMENSSKQDVISAEDSSQPDAIPASKFSQEETNINSSLTSVIAENRCKNCNYIVKPGKKFCPSCGSKIINE